MPELLLIEAATDRSDPAADDLSRWAADRHDELDSRGCSSPADQRRLTSWLRVQAVGRATVTITETRVGKYAGVWAAAAQPAGLTVRLLSTTGESNPPADVVMDRGATNTSTAAAMAVGIDNRWRTRSRVWLLDRAEAVGRVTIRAIQR